MGVGDKVQRKKKVGAKIWGNASKEKERKKDENHQQKSRVGIKKIWGRGNGGPKKGKMKRGVHWDGGV